MTLWLWAVTRRLETRTQILSLYVDLSSFVTSLDNDHWQLTYYLIFIYLIISHETVIVFFCKLTSKYYIFAFYCVFFLFKRYGMNSSINKENSQQAQVILFHFNAYLSWSRNVVLTLCTFAGKNGNLFQILYYFQSKIIILLYLISIVYHFVYLYEIYIVYK